MYRIKPISSLFPLSVFFFHELCWMSYLTTEVNWTFFLLVSECVTKSLSQSAFFDLDLFLITFLLLLFPTQPKSHSTQTFCTITSFVCCLSLFLFLVHDSSRRLETCIRKGHQSAYVKVVNSRLLQHWLRVYERTSIMNNMKIYFWDYIHIYMREMLELSSHRARHRCEN